MAVVADSISRSGHNIDAHHTNRCNKTKLVLYKPLIHIYSRLKHLYIGNKMIHFSYKDGCGVHGCVSILMYLKEELVWAR